MKHRRLALFDIDGTLLLSGGICRTAMMGAARELFGKPFVWDGIDAAGRLDPHIFADAAAQSGMEVSEQEHRAFRSVYARHLQGELERAPEKLRVLPGIRRVLEHLRTLENVVLGLLTGNYEATATLKVEAAGFPRAWFQVGAFGDEAASRAELVPVALKRFSKAYGERLASAQVVVIGDTPKDIHCAKENGALAFGVATGSFDLQELLAAGADVATESLEDPEPLLKILARRVSSC